MSNITIQCPVCEWQPDGEAHWRCSCGFSWNTFETKGKCPACNKQWEVTWCPGCGTTSPHKDWYVDKDLQVENNDTPKTLELKRRKKVLEERLISLGINNCRVSYLPYLDHSAEQFQTPYNAGCRLLILNAVAYCAHNLAERKKIIRWLKSENIWDKVSDKERMFLEKEHQNKKTRVDFSWRIESAMTLGWAMNLFDQLPEINRVATGDEMDAFFSLIPEFGGETKTFLNSLDYRNLEEVYMENLLNEMVAGYLRDLFVYGKKNETSVNTMVSFERHLTLNWLRQFSGIAEWDDTDIST